MKFIYYYKKKYTQKNKEYKLIGFYRYRSNLLFESNHITRIAESNNDKY